MTKRNPSWLATARVAAGLSQDQLAAKTGTTRQAVVNWEYGRRFPSRRVVPLICDALGVTVVDLYKHINPPQSSIRK